MKFTSKVKFTSVSNSKYCMFKHDRISIARNSTSVSFSSILHRLGTKRSVLYLLPWSLSVSRFDNINRDGHDDILVIRDRTIILLIDQTRIAPFSSTMTLTTKIEAQLDFPPKVWSCELPLHSTSIPMNGRGELCMLASLFPSPTKQLKTLRICVPGYLSSYSNVKMWSRALR